MADEDAPQGAGSDAPGTALERRTITHEVLLPLDVSAQQAAMQTYQQGLKSILDATDWQGTNDKPFVKKSGWRKIAAWFNVSIEKVPGSDRVERGPDGTLLRAEVWVRATAPNGRYAEGDGYCDVDEPRFKRSSARQKLENDLRGTAATRATNRAISNLVGMGAVSAEEVDGAGEAAGPPYGVEASEAVQASMMKALAFLLDTGDGPRDDLALAAFNAIGAKLDYIPDGAARAIGLTAGVLKRHLDGDAPTPPVRSDEPPEAVEGEPIPDADVVPDGDPTDTPPAPSDLQIDL